MKPFYRAINYHIISLDIRLTTAGHRNLAGLSDRFIRSGPRASISRQDWPIVLIDRCPGEILPRYMALMCCAVVCGLIVFGFARNYFFFKLALAGPDPRDTTGQLFELLVFSMWRHFGFSGILSSISLIGCDFWFHQLLFIFCFIAIPEKGVKLTKLMC